MTHNPLILLLNVMAQILAQIIIGLGLIPPQIGATGFQVPIFQDIYPREKAFLDRDHLAFSGARGSDSKASGDVDFPPPNLNAVPIIVSSLDQHQGQICKLTRYLI